MGSFSDYTENKLLNHVFKGAAFTQPTGLYLALSTADPLDAGSGILEPVGNGYARVATGLWNAAASRVIDNAADITFAAASGSWGTVSHWAVFDAITAGNMIAHGSLTLPKEIVTSNVPKINAGDIDVSFASGVISTYLANALLDHVFKNTAYIQPTNICIALSTANPGDTNATIAEPVGNNYARVTSNIWGNSIAGSTNNTNAIVFPTATGSWGIISHVAVFDAATLGNMLIYGAVSVSQLVTTDDIPQWTATSFQVSLD